MNFVHYEVSPYEILKTTNLKSDTVPFYLDELKHYTTPTLLTVKKHIYKLLSLALSQQNNRILISQLLFSGISTMYLFSAEFPILRHRCKQHDHGYSN